MIKTYEIFNSEKLHEYTITAEEKDDGTIYVMTRSMGGHWTHPGELILSCIDKGDLELIFDQKMDQKKMDYSRMTELRIFFNTISHHDKGIGNYKMIETTNTVEV